MAPQYEPINTEYFFTRLFGKSSHGSAGTFQEDRFWRADLDRALWHLGRYIETNLPFTDSAHRDSVEGLLANLRARVKIRSPFREQALVTALFDLCLCLLGDVPNHRDRKRVAHPKHFALDHHRDLHYGQSIKQRARLIGDACDKTPRPKGLTEKQAKAARERYWRSIYPRKRYSEYVEWFRTTHPEAYVALFS